MRRQHYLPFLAFLAVGCGDGIDSDELTAEQQLAYEAAANEAAGVAGPALRALTSASVVSVDSAAAQTGGNTPAAPAPRGPCVTIRFGPGVSLTVDHGVGCQIGPAFVSGAYVLRLLHQQQLGLEIEFQTFTVDTLSLDGPISAGVGSGRISAAMDLDVTDNGVTHQLDFMGSLSSPPGAVVVDGTGAYEVGGTRWSFEANAIRQTLGACYPDDGSIVLTGAGGLPVTFTFTATTPQTGLVEVRVAGIPLSPIPLPAYGACPPQP